MKILLADDKDFRRKEISEFLKNAGYQLILAGNGLSALTLFLTNASEIKLVITDTKMPKMTGSELVKEILSIRPDIAIIGMSNREESRDYYDHFWNKNNQPEILLEIIGKLLSK